MMPTQGRSLYKLQLVDTELAEQRSRLRETEGLLGETKELREARASHERAVREASSWRTRLKDLEFELHRLEDKIAATEKQLYGGGVTNPKELHGMQQEHEYLKRTHRKLEDDILQAMEQVELCERQLATALSRVREIEAMWRDQQDRLAKQVAQLQDKISNLQKERQAAVAGLEPAVLATYEELMRKKAGRAVALLVGQTCGGCRVTLPSSKAQEVRRGQQLVTCTNCGRILVVE